MDEEEPRIEEPTEPVEKEATEPGREEAAEEAATDRRRRRRRRVRWLRAFRVLRYSVAIIVVLAVLFFTQTGPGHRVVLEELLQSVQGSLAGELTIESLSSRSLLLGATLHRVRLDAEGGRPFLTADSVVLRYSPLSLAVGSPRVRSTVVYGLHVEISRYPGDDFANVNRIVARGTSPDTATSRPTAFGLGRVAVRDGTLEVLTPAEDAPEELTVEAPGGGRLRRIALEGLDFDLERVLFRTAGPVMVDARLASLSTSVYLVGDPLVLREAQGDLAFGDLGLRITDGAFRLPGSFLEGRLRVGPDRPGDPWVFVTELVSEDWSDLADIGWVDPRIPSGSFRGSVDVRVQDGIEVALNGVDVQAEGSTLRFDGGARFADEMSLTSLRVAASPLVVGALGPWIGRELPFEGRLSGNATLSGTLADLSATGRATFAPDVAPDAVTTADFRGTVHSGENPGGTAVEVRLEPFDYRVLEPVWPAAGGLASGRVIFTVEGRARDGILVVADATHRSDATASSRIVGRGLLRKRADGEWSVDVRGDLAPLSLPLLGRIWPQVDLPGSFSGPVRVDGTFANLHLAGDLTGEAGRAVVDVWTDVTAPTEGYRVEAETQALDLSAFTTAVPSPSTFTGRATIEGSGLAPDSIEGSAVVSVSSARVGHLDVDSAEVSLHVQDGLLTADTLRADIAGVLLAGAGSVGLAEGREGEAHVSFSAETLLGLRPLLMGDSVLVADTLNPLELDALRARGIDPDTLPSTADVRMSGALDGTADMRGWLGDLDLDLRFDLAGATYGHNAVDSAHVSLTASGLPQTVGDWDVDLAASRVVVGPRRFDQVRFDGAMLQRRGEGVLDVLRGPSERYYLTGAFALDSLGGELRLTDANVELGNATWVLDQPMAMEWNDSSLTVDGLRLEGTDGDPMSLTASGTLTRGGDSDFRMTLEGFRVEQALQVAQREDLDLSGNVNLSLDVVGPAEAPVISARFDVGEPRYGSFGLTRMEGSLEYRDRSSEVALDAWLDERRVLTGGGVIPVDLALTDVERRTVDEEMDVSLTVDEMDAALAMGYLSALENVVGSVSAEMHVGGTMSRPEPSGRVTLSNAAWTIEALGVRHRGVSGELVLAPDRTVTVDLSTVGTGAASGSSRVSGVVRLEPEVTDPSLDLAITFDRFLAVDRRDMQGRISGDLTLTGRYRLPVTQGSLRMDEATLFVEEFARNVGVVDLRSPLAYAPGMAVDTAVFVSQPLIAGLSNPFLDNLRVNVDLAVTRDLWLRSRDMNVEMGGDLILRYDRAASDLVLVGELEALRGSYVVFGRTFEVEGGTASFLGQPGINPTLDIQALTRVRRQEGGALEIEASVRGTLVEPIVELSSEEAGLSQSDLISYMVFGIPAAQLGAGEQGLGQNIAAGGARMLTGALVNQLGTAIAQELPLVNSLDYLSFSQSAAVGAGTQVEVGKYLNEDVFVVFVFGGTNAAAAEGDAGTSFTLRGVRMELEVAESLFLELFMEDRFIRSGSAGLGPTGLQGDQVVGIFMFSEWGYGGVGEQEQQ